jgi:hypothetical protein
MAGLDPLSQMLGEINAKLEMVLKTQSEDREASAKYRTDIRRDLGEVKDSVTDLKFRAGNNADEIAEARAEISALQTSDKENRTRWDQLEGASRLTKILWGIFLALGGGGILVLISKIVGWPKP